MKTYDIQLTFRSLEMAQRVVLALLHEAAQSGDASLLEVARVIETCLEQQHRLRDQRDAGQPFKPLSARWLQ